MTFEEQFGEQYGETIRRKYALKRNGKYIENSYEDIVNRIVSKAKEHKNIMNKQDIALFKEALLERRIVLGGSITTSFGTSNLMSLSNCYAIPQPHDSYDGIHKTDNMLSNIMKRRGGVGVDLSSLRPKGSKINNAAVTSTGIVPFMRRYSNTTLEVAQGGRRGALMLTLDYRHKDAKDFINAKLNLKDITGANISIRVDKGIFLTENKELLNNIARNAWKSAEPGVLFWDNILDNPIDAMNLAKFRTTTTNPCGEIPLNPYGSCIIAHPNIYAYVKNKFRTNAKLDIEQLKQDVAVLTKFMNVVVNEELEHIKRILEVAESGYEKELWTNISRILMEGRRIGIGKTGIADAMAALGMDYGIINFANIIGHVIKLEVFKTSMELPIEAPILKVFRNRDTFFKHPFIKEMMEILPRKYKDMIPANIGFITLAPVGTGSLITETSSGMEPVFMINYKRKRRFVEGDDPSKAIIHEDGEKFIEYDVFHKPYLEWATINGYVEDPMKGFEKSPYYNNLAEDINVEKKIMFQAALQRHTDQSISVTHNVPRSYPQENVVKLIKLAHKVGLKGFTMYREGSREGILIKKSDNNTSAARKRPPKLLCDIHNVKIDGKDWIVLVGLLNNEPYEIFALKVKGIILKNIKKAYLEESVIDKRKVYNLKSDVVEILDLTSHYKSGNEEVFTRLLSRLLRKGESIENITNDFEKVSLVIGTFENVLLRVLNRYVKEKKIGEVCSLCGGEVMMIEGCRTCKVCGNSKCS